MIITFWDKTKVSITEDRAHRIAAAINAGTELLEIDGNYYKTSAIASITKPKSATDHKMVGGAVYAKDVDRTPTIELTDEQREKNLGKIRQLKEQFLLS
jgi:hypothetical protein